ncbi:hypothetical protein BH09ACT8_BH09ACT8_62540 [soil metagenome]
MTINSIAGLTVGERIPPRVFEVTRAAVVRYAGASGDLNPLHYDDDAARSAGMSGAFAHGMFSAGCLATSITDAAGIDALTRFAVRFRGQARLGATLTSETVVTCARPTPRGALVDLDCRLLDEDAAVIVSANAVLAIPPTTPDLSAAEKAVAPARLGLVGTRLPTSVVTIERGPVQVFATAVGDGNPLYRYAPAALAYGLDGIPVPPTYLFAAANWGLFSDQQPPAAPGSASLIELIAALRNGREGVILHGEQEFSYYLPVRVGDVLHVDGFVESVEDKPGRDGRAGMTVMVVRTDYIDPMGKLRTTARSTYLFRPATH